MSNKGSKAKLENKMTVKGYISDFTKFIDGTNCYEYSQPTKKEHKGIVDYIGSSVSYSTVIYAHNWRNAKMWRHMHR